MSPLAKTTDTKSSYHHGDLRHALIEAAEAILLEHGVEGFSLREAARRAGVSPGAPSHHFGDARGLLTVVATRGFNGLSRALGDADNATIGQAPVKRLHAQGHAYVGFAMAHPAWFELMWRCDRLDRQDAAYLAAASAAFMRLQTVVLGPDFPPEPPAPDGSQTMHPKVMAAWSLVHGYACLARQGLFDPAQPGLLDGVLDSLPVIDWMEE